MNARYARENQIIEALISICTDKQEFESEHENQQIVYQVLGHAFNKFSHLSKNAKDNEGVPPLCHAASYHNLYAMQWFFDKKEHPGHTVDVNLIDDKGTNTALSRAVQYKDLGGMVHEIAIHTAIARDCVDLLLSNKADPWLLNCWAVRIACQKGNLVFVRHFFEKIWPKRKRLNAAELCKVIFDNGGILESPVEVINYFFDFFEKNNTSHFQFYLLGHVLELYKANNTRAEEIKKIIIQKTGESFTSIDLKNVIQWGRLDIVKMLVEQHKMLVAGDTFCRSAEQSSNEVFSYLLANFDRTRINNAYLNPMEYAVRGGILHHVKLLLRHGAIYHQNLANITSSPPVKSFLFVYNWVQKSSFEKLNNEAQLQLISCVQALTEEDKDDLFVLFKMDTDKTKFLNLFIPRISAPPPYIAQAASAPSLARLSMFSGKQEAPIQDEIQFYEGLLIMTNAQRFWQNNEELQKKLIEFSQQGLAKLDRRPEGCEGNAISFSNNSSSSSMKKSS
jgi:hypothetical protein